MADSMTMDTRIHVSHCGQCDSDNRQVPAVNWCLECEEVICTSCTKNHSLYKPLRNHHIVDIKLKESHFIVDVISDTKCDIHGGREIEYFCVDHDQVCCRDCLAKTHKTCENTTSIESASENIKYSGIITEYKDRLDSIVTSASNLVENRKNNSIGIMKENGKIKDQVKQCKQHLIARLHEMETDMLEKLTKITEDRTNHISKEINDTDRIKEKVESYKQSITFFHDHVSNKNTFLFIRKLENRLQHTESDLENIISNCRNASIGYKESSEIGSLVKTFGTIDVEENQCSVKFTSSVQCHAQMPTVTTTRIHTFELKHIISISNKIVTGIAVTDDNKILLCDRSGYGQILVYNDRNAFIKEINTLPDPWDIAVVPRRNEAVVSFKGINSILFIDTNNLACDRTVDIGVKVEGGVATTTDKILIGGYGEIHVLNFEGKQMKTISVSGASVDYISIGVNNTNYFYSSNHKAYYCVKENGNQMFSHAIPNESVHRNVETDLEGNFYIVGRDTNTIQRLRPNGSVDRVILDSSDEIREPLAICFNGNCTKLYVSNYGDSKLLVFDCK